MASPEVFIALRWVIVRPSSDALDVVQEESGMAANAVLGRHRPGIRCRLGRRRKTTDTSSWSCPRPTSSAVQAATDSSGFGRSSVSPCNCNRVGNAFSALNVTVCVDTESVLLAVHYTTMHEYNGHIGLQVAQRNTTALQSPGPAMATIGGPPRSSPLGRCPSRLLGRRPAEAQRGTWWFNRTVWKPRLWLWVVVGPGRNVVRTVGIEQRR